MSHPSHNAVWCRALAEELRRAGAVAAFLCPGSRNAPLLFALAEVFGGDAHPLAEERSAAFAALGVARATGRPAVVCVTSGSAVANLAPALLEAAAAGLPLIAVAADRPRELHDCGAPQTAPQTALLAPVVRETVLLPEPLADLAMLRARVSRAAQRRDGPVHIAVPLREPLATPPAAALHPGEHRIALGCGESPYTQVVPPAGGLLPAVPWLQPGRKGLIVAGALGPAWGEPIRTLARATGFPLLADATSCARLPDCPELLCLGDALLAGPCASLRPDLVIQVGPLTLSRPVHAWLADCDCPWLALEDAGMRDWRARAWAAVERPGEACFRALADRCAPGDPAWRSTWLGAEAAARHRLSAWAAKTPWGEPLAAHLALGHAGFAFVHLASSMPVRHGNLHCLPASRPIFANRGTNGIDGTLGTFLGLAHALRDPGLCLLGDLACLHDLPALAAWRELGARGALVVLDNGGGGIFGHLPVAQIPGWERWVRTPQNLDLGGAARLFGLEHHPVADAAALGAALDRSTAGGLHLIECRLRGRDQVTPQRELLTALSGSCGVDGGQTAAPG